MPWQQKELLPPLPPELQLLVDNLTGVKSTVEAVAVPLADALNAIKAFFISTVDPFATLMNAIITETENLINDLFGAGAFQLIVSPFTVGGVNRRTADGKIDKFGFQYITPDRAIKEAIKSFDDLGDPNRPQFSENAPIAAFGILITVKDIGAYLKALELLNGVWTLSDVQFALARMKETVGGSASAQHDGVAFNAVTPGPQGNKIVLVFDGVQTVDQVVDAWNNDPTTVEQDLLVSFESIANPLTPLGLPNPDFKDGSSVLSPATVRLQGARTSKGADWNSIRFNQIGQLALVQDQLLKILALAKGYTLVPDSIQNLIDALLKKIQQIQDAADLAQQLIDDLTNIQGLADAWIFDLPVTTGGNAAVKEALKNAELQAPDKFIFRYTFFALYVGGGPGPGPTTVETIGNLIK